MSSRINRANELLKKWKKRNEHLILDEHIELMQLLETIAKQKEKDGDHWGAMVTTGLLVQVKNSK